MSEQSIPVAVIPTEGTYTLTEITAGTEHRPWHADLILTGTGSGVQFWIQPTTEPVNWAATRLAQQLNAIGRWDYLNGPVLVCGTTGNDHSPEQVPPLALMLLETP